MPEQADVEAVTGMESHRDLKDTLYHYTDINGLKGIWEEGHLWATGSRYLNDTSELRLGMVLLQSRAAKRRLHLMDEDLETVKRELELRKDEQPVDFATLTAKNAPELRELEEISSAAEAAEKYMDSHIACLSEKHDQLSQWRGYARDGYCVGLDTKLLLESLNDDRVMRRVHYSDETTNEAYASQIIEIAKQHRRIMLEHPALVDIDEERRRFIIARRITVHASFVKDRNFCEEKEVRIVEINGTPDKFTPHRYGMVPRVLIPLPDGCVRSVTIGPTPHKDLKLRSLFDYFHAVRFKKRDGRPPEGELIPEVGSSKIPFRDW